MRGGYTTCSIELETGSDQEYRLLTLPNSPRDPIKTIHQPTPSTTTTTTYRRLKASWAALVKEEERIVEDRRAARAAAA